MIIGLSGEAGSAQCAAGMCCLPEEQYKSRVDSLNNALAQQGEYRTQRWYFLAGGVALGALVGALVGRAL